jgi:antitoxin CptB
MLDPDPSATRRRRILFRATHRGTHENDLLVGGFVKDRIELLDDADLDAIEEILELPDVALADWLTGRQPIPADVDSDMLRAIRAAALR